MILPYITQTISKLPVVEGRYGSDFIQQADAFLNTLPNWSNELNEYTTQVNNQITWINTAATNAFAAANFKGVWDENVEYKAGESVTYNGLPYFAIEDNISEQPDTSEKWIQILTTNGGYVYGDIEFTKDIYGLVIIDRADNTKKWRIFVNDGNLGTEEV